MNVKIDTEIRTAYALAKSKGIKILQGAWFEFDSTGAVVGCDAIGAVLLKNNLVPEGIGLDTIRLSTPGFCASACKALEVNGSWLHRFFMGFDRGYQVMIEDKESKKESRDDVSAYGIQLWREFNK